MVIDHHASCPRLFLHDRTLSAPVSGTIHFKALLSHQRGFHSLVEGRRTLVKCGVDLEICIYQVKLRTVFETRHHFGTEQITELDKRAAQLTCSKR